MEVGNVDDYLGRNDLIKQRLDSRCCRGYDPVIIVTPSEGGRMK